MNNTSKNFKNGLSETEVTKAIAILESVNLSEICRKLKIKPTTIHNVFRDRSPRVDLLYRVLLEAKAEIKNRDQVFKKLKGELKEVATADN